MTTTGQRLRALREQRGQSQEDIAKLIGVGRTTYLKYESDENKPTRKLKELSDLFNVTSDYIMCLSDNPHGAPAQPTTSAPSYYHDPEVAQMANEIKDNPGMRILFDASRDLKKESIEEVVKFIEFQKAKERGDWD